MRFKSGVGFLCFLISLFTFALNACASKKITIKEIELAQKKWGNCIIKIGKAYTEGKDYKAIAEKCVSELYGYDEGVVLFKPTKASVKQFRLTKEEAISYFVGGVVPEDHGFALQPWSKVRFEPAGFVIGKDLAVTMGNYYFTDANTGKEVKAEYSFGYKRAKDGRLVIILHHSSFPYNPKH